MTIKPLPEAVADAGIKFAMDAMRQIPKDDSEALEAHLTGVLIVFWGALWGSFGTDYARDFIAAQLRGMECDKSHDRFTLPSEQ